jgi:hypothetical protein
MGKDGRFGVAVTFDERRGYVGTHPELRGGLMVGETPNIDRCQSRPRAAFCLRRNDAAPPRRPAPH